MWDLDALGTVYIDGIQNTMGYFREMPEVDAICANGIYRIGDSTIYYDTYAHLDLDDNFHIKNKLAHDVKKRMTVRKAAGELPYKVKSCFSGFTIYRVSSLLPNDVRYYPPSERLECEHVTLSEKLNVYLNPSMIHLLLLND